MEIIKTNFINNLENLCKLDEYNGKYLYITDNWTIGYLKTCENCGSHLMTSTDISIPFEHSSDNELLDILSNHCELFVPKVYDGDNLCSCK